MNANKFVSQRRSGLQVCRYQPATLLVSFAHDAHVFEEDRQFTGQERLWSIDESSRGLRMKIDEDHVRAGDDTLGRGVQYIGQTVRTLVASADRV